MIIAALPLAAIVALGATTQRLTGVGFALVASPLLVLLLGPIQGVVITNVFGVATALVVYLTNVQRVEYRKVVPLLIAATVAAIPGALLARYLPPAVLATGAGLLVIIALGVSVFARRLPGLTGTRGLLGAGALSGFMNVIAGVGGPAVTAYAVATHWEHRRFAISIQFYFAVLGCVSLLSRGALPALSAIEWLFAVAALVVGMVAGHFLTQKVSPKTARNASLIVALLGGIAVIVRGLTSLG